MMEHGTILVVDDDTELREGLTALLGQRGYRTLEADDGLAASDLIDRHRPDLVILDMMMPRWGGLAVLERFCGKSGAPPFIMITANEGPKHKGYAEQMGVIDFIRKPFPMERLLERVEKLMPPRQTAVPETSDSAIRCRCGGCGARIKAPVHMLGTTRACPGCKRPILIAYPPPEDEGAILMMD
jgi:DNA-binding response OmpR family regulator